MESRPRPGPGGTHCTENSACQQFKLWGAFLYTTSVRSNVMGTSTTKNIKNSTSGDSPPVLACSMKSFILRIGTVTLSSETSYRLCWARIHQKQLMQPIAKINNKYQNFKHIMEINAIFYGFFWNILYSLWGLYIFEHSLEMFESVTTNLSSSIFCLQLLNFSFWNSQRFQLYDLFSK